LELYASPLTQFS